MKINQASIESISQQVFLFHSTLNSVKHSITDKFLLFLDIDGTLAELQSRPENAFIPQSTLKLLQQLHQYCSIYFITGRSIQDAVPLFKPHHWNIIGSHGAEIQTSIQKAPQHLLVVDQSSVKKLNTYVKKHQNAWHPLLIERKPYSIAFHYRQHPEAKALAETAAQSCITQCPEFKIKAGKCVYEVVLNGINKGAAITKICQDACDHLPLFIGDDVTDEDGFAAINRINGISIKVGHEHTEAQFQVKDISEVTSLLHEFLRQFKLYTAPMEGESTCLDSLSYPTG